MEEEQTPTVSLISCMHFVRRGVAKAVPEKIELTEKELEKIIKQTAEDLHLTEQGDDESGEEGEASASAPRDPPADPNDEFNFANYDEEGPIYNKEEGSFYVHHDIILPWFPLCIEWLSHDPTDPQPGKNTHSYAKLHHDIILPWFPLCIEWLSHDPTDPQPGKNTHSYAKLHHDIILPWFPLCIEWLSHDPTDPQPEAQTLLTGSCDGHVRVTDCRAPESHRAWQLPPEIERVQWDLQNPFCFAMSNNEGKVAYVDCRHDEPLWTINAHEKEVTVTNRFGSRPLVSITTESNETMDT
ncbi:Wd-repeat protein [Operophtera brumata]|uniref:Wd-repeat protein n=1 Tax=Operophtera brumata TaxID=104452 RepID=A0A0L7KYR6_OPEBR|nr:Wd-repeat protein [Operophtera brumata]